MEKFSLEKWLENPSRKVVTRLNKQVQIISTEGRDDIPIIALVEGIAHQYKSNGFHADVIATHTNQCCDMGDYDLFFADEGEELTEFEQELRYWIGQSLCNYENNGCVSDNMSDSVNIYLKTASKKLLDLARKEILKDLPEWKKCDDNLPYSHIGGLNERYLTKNGYCIKISDLETLPKEE